MTADVIKPLRTFRFRVKDKTSGKKLAAMARAVNMVWNHCNGAQVHALRHNQKWPTKAKFQELTKGSSRLIGLSSQSIQCVCEEYYLRRQKSKKAKLRWRGKRSLGWVPFKNQTIQLRGTVIVMNGHKFRLWKHRDLAGAIKCGNFSQDARGRWYCNLVCETDTIPHGRNAEVGIDLGLVTLATLSTGDKIKHPRAYRSLETELSSAQRANKRRRAQAINAKIANIRKDFLHKETTKIAARFGMICVGNISPKWQQMVNGKSASDVSWAAFKAMLQYKAIARGAVFEEVSEMFSTQLCSECYALGGPKGREGLKVREWVCGECKTVHDRDVNAARNILRAGRGTLVEGSSSLSS